jgi:hypothetical protein
VTPTEEEFAIWQENPITQWVLAGLERYADLQKAVFKDAMWAASDEPADWERLRIARARAKTREDAYRGLAELSYDNACGLHEDSDAQDAA